MKNLFFTALVAIVAVSGAYPDIYLAGSNTRLPCRLGELTCAIEYGILPVFNVPDENPGGPYQGDFGTVDYIIDYALEQ